ncbi:hypothetical protein BDV29DRAFT_180639 [Aspergillus leporis]|uniref:Uncharacterized protein n=1 Tax=Aspergillus leporis TaxID=41062 RepID=A0A5N5WTW6_9EURO|nr:hypothetical protein BDV29DRAFT_180639 [Aspergillus leporis]
MAPSFQLSLFLPPLTGESDMLAYSLYSFERRQTRNGGHQKLRLFHFYGNQITIFNLFLGDVISARKIEQRHTLA